MTKKKPRSWLAGKKLPIAGIATLLALFGAVWKLDDHWVPREIHNVAVAQMIGAIERLQKAQDASEIRSQEFYWQRRESELRAELRKRPNDPQLLRDYQEAMDERRRCQDQVKGIKK